MARLGDRRALWWYALIAAIVLGVGLREVVGGASSGDAVVVDAGARAQTPTAEESGVEGGNPGAAASGTAVQLADGGGGGSGDGAKRLVVHVAGAVRRPGVYRLRAGSRVNDAVRRAGGLRPDAEATAVNLAAELEDGRQVVVPVRVGVAPGAGGGSGAGGVAAAGPGAAGSAAGAASGAMPGTPINLNTASAEQLDGLDGVGPGIAAKILAYRQEHGGFRTVDELGEVPGIGDKRLEALRPLVTV